MKTLVEVEINVPTLLKAKVNEKNKNELAERLALYYNSRPDIYFSKPVTGQEFVFDHDGMMCYLEIAIVVENKNGIKVVAILTDLI